VILRLVVYQLTDGKIIRVLTSRHDLSALSIAMLYKERWSIEICQTQPVKMTWSPVRTENSILAMKSPLSVDAAPISSSN